MTERVLAEPLKIAKDGGDWLVILSVEEFERLGRRERRVYRAENIMIWQTPLPPPSRHRKPARPTSRSTASAAEPR